MSTTSSPFFRLDGRVAIVTGGGQSVGEGIAHRLAEAGARVAIFDLNGDAGASVAKAIGGIAVAGDQTCEADVVRLVAEVTEKFGRIVSVASIAGKEGNPTLIPYSASKAALINMTKALAKEVVGKGDITVNAISPAVIRTKMLETIPQSTIDYMVSKIPMGRTCEISEVAALVHFLASSESSFTTGQCYDISGGRATY